MQQIIPFLWFDDNAEEAMKFYVSIFRTERRVWETMMQMTKIDIPLLQRAYDRK